MESQGRVGGYDWPSPDYGFFVEGTPTEVRTRHRLGAAYHWNQESTVCAAWTSPGTTGPSRFDLGLEIWFYDVFAIRSGLTDLARLPDPGTSAQRFQYAGGIGLRQALAFRCRRGDDARPGHVVPLQPDRTVRNRGATGGSAAMRRLASTLGAITLASCLSRPGR